MSSQSVDAGLFDFNEQQLDFSPAFEHVFFSLVPSAVFTVVSLWVSVAGARKPVIVAAPVLEAVKLGFSETDYSTSTVEIKKCFTVTYAVLELALLVTAVTGGFHVTSILAAASASRLVAALSMVLLSYTDHRKSRRPSVLLGSYVALTLLLDVAQARTQSLLPRDDRRESAAYRALFLAVVALKLVILLPESLPKTRWMHWDATRHSPEETSGILSLGVFFWLNRLFLSGYRHVLTIHQLFPLDSSLDGELLHAQFSRRLHNTDLQGDRLALLKVLTSTMKGTIALTVLPRLALLGFTLSQPFFIERLLKSLSKPMVPASISYGLVGVVFVIYTGMAVSMSLYRYYQNRMLAMARAMLVMEIYSKLTKLDAVTASDNAAVTLMSTDWERINEGFRQMHDIWASLIQISVAAWMLHRKLGLVFLAPLGVVLVCSVGISVVSRLTSGSQRVWMESVEKRVGLTATIIGHMKSLKMSGLSSAISDLVQRLRLEELVASSRFRRLRVIAAAWAFAPMLLAPPITLAFAQRELDAQIIFTSLSFLLLCTQPLCDVFQAIPKLIGGNACLSRIQLFLESEDHQDFRSVYYVGGKPTSQSEKELAFPEDAIEIKDGQFGWEKERPVLRNVDVRIAKSSLNMVVGPVGSGKSTFCKAILGETAYNQGKVLYYQHSSHVGYCDQVPFLSNDSIKDNIVGNSEWNVARYNEVIDATALRYDIDSFEQGDRTKVGSDGITLSGGQKQRVALARALYLKTDLLVLDDVFSGLDAGTEEVVFRQIFSSVGLLRRRGCTVILCTHSVRHIAFADHIIVLSGGTVAEQGGFAELMATEDGYVRCLGLGSAAGGDSVSEKTVVLAKDQKDKEHCELEAVSASNIAKTEADLTTADLTRRQGDTSVYRHYFRSTGVWPAMIGMVFMAGFGFFENFPTIWLKYWSDASVDGYGSHGFGYFAGIYATLQVSAILCLMVAVVFICVIGMKRAGASLHQKTLTTMIGASLSFFTTTDTGVIANLFSQDLNLVDTELPLALTNCGLAVCQVTGQACIFGVTTPYIAVGYPFLTAVLYLVQRFYLSTSRQLRLLDLEAKSPLYTHFLDTTKGVVTLRAFGFIGRDMEKASRLLNASQRPAYLLVMVQQWLTVVLNLMVMVLATGLTVLATQLHASSGFTGASFVTLMTFGENLSDIVQYYTALETSMGAIARLKTFCSTVEPESKHYEDIFPPEEWPHKGEVTIKSVSASYEASSAQETDESPNLALRNIELSISGGEKIAVCGRTGSGKSSLIALLLKLLDSTAQSADGIAIDGIALRRVQRPVLRQRLLAVPQEAVFMPDGSSFKENLDPTNKATMEDCEAVLKMVELWHLVQRRGGLESGMKASMLSAGQKQLMSLGRAVLRRRIRARSLGAEETLSEGGLLLLDEVSSSVDVETERIMQQVFKHEFVNYTVISVSHRLEMIMDFDRVVVMDAGEIVEVGNPEVLANEEGSRFRDLVKASRS